ncbi:MAG: ABC transporter ATP-binding protein [Terriglobia bacterium]|jgi:NitT/TauT family transport system ATP-binding protein
MSPSAPILEIRELNKVYHSGRDSVPAIGSVSFSVGRGEFVAIIGPSGCGKSTLLKIIGDLLEPSAGFVSVDGLSAHQARLKGRFSFVFQNPVLLPWRRIIDNVRLPLEVLGRHSREPEQLLQMVGLAGFEKRYPQELSGGMQHRAALARALTFDPQLLLLDEPFGALDEFTRDALNQQLLQIWQETGVTILFVTHGIGEALFLADRVIVLSGRPATVREAFKVPFPRPRPDALKETEYFQEVVKSLREKLE